MPTVRSLRHGFTAGVPPSTSRRNPGKREACQGWTNASSRANTRFLYGVDERQLSGSGFALTLTVRDCPATPQEWHRLRRALFKRLERAGMMRLHWATEWQRRGVPHLHCAIYWPDPSQRPDVLRTWCEIAADYGAGLSSQHETPIWDVLGWVQYVSKHASRGVSNYQRSPEYIPAGWRGISTGRMWGRWGDWPAPQEIGLSVDMAAFHALRRVVRKRSEAMARQSVENNIEASQVVGLLASMSPGDRRYARRIASDGEVRRLRWTRRRLKCPDPALSTVRGLSEWLPQDLLIDLARWLDAAGHVVEHADDEARSRAAQASAEPRARAPSPHTHHTEGSKTHA